MEPWRIVGSIFEAELEVAHKQLLLQSEMHTTLIIASVSREYTEEAAGSHLDLALVFRHWSVQKISSDFRLRKPPLRPYYGIGQRVHFRWSTGTSGLHRRSSSSLRSLGKLRRSGDHPTTSVIWRTRRSLYDYDRFTYKFTIRMPYLSGY